MKSKFMKLANICLIAAMLFSTVMIPVSAESDETEIGELDVYDFNSGYNNAVIDIEELCVGDILSMPSYSYSIPSEFDEDREEIQETKRFTHTVSDPSILEINTYDSDSDVLYFHFRGLGTVTAQVTLVATVRGDEVKIAQGTFEFTVALDNETTAVLSNNTFTVGESIGNHWQITNHIHGAEYKTETIYNNVTFGYTLSTGGKGGSPFWGYDDNGRTATFGIDSFDYEKYYQENPNSDDISVSNIYAKNAGVYTENLYVRTPANSEYRLIATQDVTVSSTGTSTLQIEDSDTGITVSASEGVLPEGTTLHVTPIVNGSNYELTKKGLSGIADQFTLYDIKLLKDGLAVQPNGKVTVSVPVPQNYITQQTKIYFIDENGQAIEMEATVADNMFSFETDHFSLYAIAQMKNKDINDVDDKNDTDDNSSDVELIKDNPKTGDNLSLSIMPPAMILLILSIFVGRKKRSTK